MEKTLGSISELNMLERKWNAIAEIMRQKLLSIAEYPFLKTYRSLFFFSIAFGKGEELISNKSYFPYLEVKSKN